MPAIKAQTPTDSLKRCDWANGDALYEQYHDEEWGVPCFDDHKLFEFLILEGAQAGLSWITILRKRENYRRIRDKLTAMGREDLAEKLLHDKKKNAKREFLKRKYKGKG